MSAMRVCGSRTCRKNFSPDGNHRKYCSKVCSKRENQRKYAEAHPEKVREALRRWEAENHEKRREYNREKTRKWRAANLEKVRRQARVYARKWRKENHDQFIASQRNRYAKRRDVLLKQRRSREGSIPRAEFLKRLRKKKRGSPKGLHRHTDAKLTFIAYCKAQGMTNYRIAKDWHVMTGDYVAPSTITWLTQEHKSIIAHRQTQIAALTVSESLAIAEKAKLTFQPTKAAGL
jgi:hypothetical protein